MKLFDRFKKAFGMEPPAVVSAANAGVINEPPIKPGKVDVRHILQFLRGGFRRPPHVRVYRKRGPKLVYVERKAVLMPHRAARLHFIWNGMREANEIRRVHRERQLEARAERRAFLDQRLDLAAAEGVL